MDVKKVVCCLLIPLFLCGCGNGQIKKLEIQQKNDSLTLSLPEPMVGLYDTALNAYKKAYPDIEVNLVTYPYEEQEAVNNMRKKLAADIMAGKGYDLYIQADIEFEDLQKVTEAGAFENLLPYFEQDTSIDRDEYLDCIFEMGQEKDQCYVLPYGISVNYLATRKDIMESTGIDLENCTNLKDQLACMEQYHDLFPERSVTAPKAGVCHDLGCLGFTPWKNEKNEEILNSSILKRIEELVKEERAYEIGSLEESMKSREDFLRTGENLCMMVYNHPDFEILCMLGGQENGVLVPELLESGKTQASTVSYTAAIASGSANKQNAWNFIKILLGDAYQKELAVAGIPVKKAAIEEWFSEQEKMYVQDTVLINGEVYPGVSKEQFEKLKESVYQTGLRIPLGYTIPNKYQECMEPYYRGKKTIEHCIQEFQKYMEIYYSE